MTADLDALAARLRHYADLCQRANAGFACAKSRVMRDAADALRALREERDRLIGERDRQYEENVARIAAQAKAEAERDAAIREATEEWNK